MCSNCISFPLSLHILHLHYNYITLTHTYTDINIDIDIEIPCIPHNPQSFSQYADCSALAFEELGTGELVNQRPFRVFDIKSYVCFLFYSSTLVLILILIIYLLEPIPLPIPLPIPIPIPPVLPQPHSNQYHPPKFPPLVQPQLQ